MTEEETIQLRRVELREAPGLGATLGQEALRRLGGGHLGLTAGCGQLGCKPCGLIGQLLGEFLTERFPTCGELLGKGIDP